MNVIGDLQRKKSIYGSFIKKSVEETKEEKSPAEVEREKEQNKEE